MALNIVYLDDEEDLCFLFKEMFAGDGINIKTFTISDEAIDEVAKNPPDLIFLDFRLPTMTGDLVALKMNNKIPKMLISGDISPKSKYDFDKIISKPWNFVELQSLINEFKNNKK